MDQMQTTNFIYHPESLIEMQAIVMILVYFDIGLREVIEGSGSNKEF